MGKTTLIVAGPDANTTWGSSPKEDSIPISGTSERETNYADCDDVSEMTILGAGVTKSTSEMTIHQRK
jgi:hypothetical protein